MPGSYQVSRSSVVESGMAPGPCGRGRVGGWGNASSSGFVKQGCTLAVDVLHCSA